MHDLIGSSVAVFPKWFNDSAAMYVSAGAGVVKEKLKEMDQVILDQLEKELVSWELPTGLMQGTKPENRWRTVSCMQKAIRHGDVDMAMNAASAAFGMDASYLFRRLGVTAVEDVGLGCLKGCLMTMAVLGAKAWRQKVGSRKIAVYLAKMLSEAPKDRLCCELVVMVEFDPTLKQYAYEHASLSREELQKIAEDDDEVVQYRMSAVRLLAGTKRFSSQYFPKMNDRPFDDFLKAMICAEKPMLFYYLAERGCSRMNESMSLSWYLAAKIAESAKDVEVKSYKLPEVVKIGSLTSAGYDMHTREGKIALNKFLKECPEVRKFAEDNEVVGEKRDCLIGFGVFLAEGAAFDKSLSYSAGNAILERAHEMELSYCGLPVEQHAPFLKSLLDNGALLNECRRKVVKAIHGLR